MVEYERFRVSGPDVVAEEFDGEFVVLDLSSGRYFSMDKAASALWQEIIRGVSVAALMASLEESAPLSPKGVAAFVQRLLDFGLIVQDDQAAGEPGTEGLKILSENSTEPTVEVFEDLADLILADPIHDVEEDAGWPLRKDRLPT